MTGALRCVGTAVPWAPPSRGHCDDRGAGGDAAIPVGDTMTGAAR